MNINLKTFAKYKRIIQNTIIKYNPYTECLFFDMKNGYCHFQNEEVFGKLKIGKDENESNLFVNAEKFLLLSSNLDEVELKNKVFKDGDNNFKLGNYGELNYETPSFDDYQECVEYNNLLQNKSLFNSLRESYHYIDKDVNDPYNAIFIVDNHIRSTDHSRFYSNELSEVIPDLELQESLMKILLYLSDDDNVYIKKKEDKLLLIINDECELIINKNINLKVPALFDKKEYFDHETYVQCDLKEFYNLIQFVLPFTNVDTNNEIILKVEQNKILISVQDEDININKYIDIVDTNLSNFDFEYVLCCADLKLLLTHLQGQDLKIQLSSDNIIEDRFTLLCFSSCEDESKKIILPTMER